MIDAEHLKGLMVSKKKKTPHNLSLLSRKKTPKKRSKLANIKSHKSLTCDKPSFIQQETTSEPEQTCVSMKLVYQNQSQKNTGGILIFESTKSKLFSMCCKSLNVNKNVPGTTHYNRVCAVSYPVLMAMIFAHHILNVCKW